MKGWNKLFYTNNNQRRAGMAILISDKIDFNSKTFKRQRRTLYFVKRVNLSRIYNNNICTNQ